MYILCHRVLDFLFCFQGAKVKRLQSQKFEILNPGI